MAFFVPSTLSSRSDLCTLYVGYIKSKIFQKSQKKKKLAKKAKIGLKVQIFQKSQKKAKFAKKPKLAKIRLFWQIWLFWQILAFLENFVLFGTSCCLSFRRLHKDFIDQEYMTQSR
jgi:hypothetical protein